MGERKKETFHGIIVDYDKTFTHLGNLSASNTTHLTPSRANTEAVYEPPGPPPITRTVACSGIDMAPNYG